VITVPSRTKKTTPQGCPQHIRNISDAVPRLHRVYVVISNDRGHVTHVTINGWEGKLAVGGQQP